MNKSFRALWQGKIGGTVVCFLQVLLVHKALVPLSASPDTATETQGSASHQMRLQF